MNIEKVCNMLEIPSQVQDMVVHCEKQIDFKSIEKELEQMKQPDSWSVALESLKILLAPDEDGMKILTCQLQCACDAYDNYIKFGISDEIFIATMKFFTRFLLDYKEKHDCYQFHLAWWAVREISMVEFRIGELEYELKIDNEKHLIDLHIPADADMTTSKLRESYLKAREFFHKFYPDFIDADMVCNTWLLAPTLKQVLPETSRILQFQKSFEIGKMEEDSLGFMDWVYGSKEIPIEELPENTSLQRKLKPFLRNNGKIAWTFGKLISNPFCETED